MKSSTKAIIAASTIAVLAGIAVAGVSHAESRWGGRFDDRPCAGEMGFGPGGPHGKWGGRHYRGMHFERMIERHDTNGDGKLTQAEIDASRAERLAKFDANGDGTLTLQEFEGLWLETARPRMVDRFQALDEDGDAVVTAEELAKRSARMVSRMDRNDDGVISREDLRRWGPGRRGGADGEIERE